MHFILAPAGLQTPQLIFLLTPYLINMLPERLVSSCHFCVYQTDSTNDRRMQGVYDDLIFTSIFYYACLRISRARGSI